MLLTYAKCIAEYKSDYQIEKAISEGQLYRIEPGLYSTEKYVSDIEILMQKYPNIIFTGDFAFYYHGLTELIPEKYAIATKAKASALKDSRITQVYMKDNLLELGAIQANYQGITIRVYDKERMLIELLRNKNTMPYDLYKEIVGNYRKIIDNLEIWRIQEYAEIFPKSKMISKALDEEIF